MSRALVILARDTEPPDGLWERLMALEPRPGDRVVAVTDGAREGLPAGPRATASQLIARFGAERGWGEGVGADLVRLGGRLPRGLAGLAEMAAARVGACEAILAWPGRGDAPFPPPAERDTAFAESVTILAERNAPPTPLRVLVWGRHARLCPLSHDALRSLFEGRVARTDDPARADLVVCTHPWDVETLPQEIVAAHRGRGLLLALLSEEPFWDTMFSPDPLAERITLQTRAHGPLEMAQINYMTGDVFAFEHIPYPLLTDHAYAQRYAARLAQGAAVPAQTWLDCWAAAPVGAVFMAERRPEAFHDARWPRAALSGLCRWRSTLASGERAGPAAPAERIGASWTDGAMPTRFALPDWHLDKLTRLDGRARMISAIENTHQPHYITEKFFDAFACGARPLYVAGARHRLHAFGLPSASWINLAGLSPEEAGDWLDALPLAGMHKAEAFREALAMLAARLTPVEPWRAERSRLAEALIAALRQAAGR